MFVVVVIDERKDFRDLMEAVLIEFFPRIKVLSFSHSREFHLRKIENARLVICDISFADCSRCPFTPKEERDYMLIVTSSGNTERANIRCPVYFKSDIMGILELVYSLEAFFLASKVPLSAILLLSFAIRSTLTYFESAL